MWKRATYTQGRNKVTIVVCSKAGTIGPFSVGPMSSVSEPRRSLFKSVVGVKGDNDIPALTKFYFKMAQVERRAVVKVPILPVDGSASIPTHCNVRRPAILQIVPKVN